MSRAKELWILNGILFTQDSHRRVLRGHLRIVDGKIAEILKTKPKRISPQATVVDASGLTIVPGFIQAHVHLCQTLFRNQADDLELLDWLADRIWLMEASHTAQTLHTSARLGIYELLGSGTTCILDMGTVRHTDAILEAIEETGIRANVGKCLMDHPQMTPECLREPTRAALEEAHAIYSRWHGKDGDRIRVSYAPRFVISCTEELLREVGRVAREQKAIIHTHASENLKEIQIIKKRVECENIEYLHSLRLTSSQLVLAHCIWLKPAEMKILQTTGTHVVHCPSSNLKLASGIARVPEMLSRGINVALGADGAPCNNNLNLFQEMRLAALLHKPGSGPKAMRAQEVLDMATLGGAHALGWSDQIGSIEIGKKADLVALNLNSPENSVPATALGARLDSEMIASSIVYSTQPHHVQQVWVDGNLLVREGKVLRIPLGPLMADVHRAQLAIHAKVKKLRQLPHASSTSRHPRPSQVN